MAGIATLKNNLNSGVKTTKKAYRDFTKWCTRVGLAIVAFIGFNGFTSTLWGLKQVIPNINVSIWIIGVILICALIGVIALLHRERRLHNNLREETREQIESYQRQVDKLQRTASVSNDDFQLQKDIVTNKYDLIIHPGSGQEVLRLNDVTDKEIAIYWEQNRLTHVLGEEISMKSAKLMLAVFQSYNLRETKLLCLNLHEVIKKRDQEALRKSQGGENDVYEIDEINFVPIDTSKPL